jgi:hypothetical protein
MLQVSVGRQKAEFTQGLPRVDAVQTPPSSGQE